MKYKNTITVFLFLVSIFTYGQKTLIKNNEILWNSKVDRQLERIKQGDHIVNQHHLFQKNRNLSQNISLKFAQANKQQLDSLVSAYWNEVNNQWFAYSKSESSYDTSTNLTQFIYYSRNETTNQWVAYFKTEYAYEADGNMTQILFYVWDETTNQWTDPYKTEYSYDGNGNMVQELSSNWDENSSIWVENEKTEYTYDTNGNMTQSIFYFWDVTASQWFAIYKEEYTYDSSTNLTQSIYFDKNETTNQWLASLKIEYVYDATGNKTQYISYSWDETSNQWVFNNKEDYSYDINGNMIQNQGYYWDETTSLWITMEKHEYTFAVNGDLTQHIGYYPHETTGQWVAEYKYEFIYNNSYSYSDLILPYLNNVFPYLYIEGEESVYFNHMLTDVDYYNWDANSSEWVITGKDNLYYSEHNISYVPEINGIELNVYPNPCSEYVSFSFPGKYNKTALELFDIQGRNVLSKEIGNEKKLGLEGLNEGIYFYILTINGKKLNGKLIKE